MTDKPQFKIYFSDFFGVTPKKIEEYGAFNISLINDLPLFVDPFLLFNSENEEYRVQHDQLIKYMVFLKGKSKQNLPKGLVQAWYYFPEVKQNWLGFSKTGNNGRGLGQEFAVSLKNNLTSIFSDFGEEENSHTQLGKLTLIKNGVGKDQISDFTCNLIRGFLAKYTQDFAEKNIARSKLKVFNIPKARFNFQTETWASGKFLLPRYGNDFVLLTPIDILTKDEAWISHRGFIEDFSGIVESVSNEQLRVQISRYLADELPIDPTLAEREVAIEKAARRFPFLMDEYVRKKERDGSGARESSAEKVQAAQQIFVNSLYTLTRLLGGTKFYETKPNSREEGLRRISFLKHVIEKQDGYRLFYVKGKPVSRESDLQVMFKLTWFASEFSSDAEVNNGRGSADFQVSYGSADKTIIEFKLAKNSQLEKNLLHQSEIYSDAARATHPPIKAILFFNDRELVKTRSLLSKHGLDNCHDVVLIDARRQDSASKAG
ncbi:hypothetical protein QTI33_12020 [Variovorax sp. J22P271]|uniref:hypothetical protein n=1 Tax=Variovorax davisae TaxID=3053515 RepID=UPI00257837FE|nr:hypothetical protein [Variovorax sp. J22P271]MDM0032850.1 hypothetical protein [Variovorax sp. J22P271]